MSASSDIGPDLHITINISTLLHYEPLQRIEGANRQSIL